VQKVKSRSEGTQGKINNWVADISCRKNHRSIIYFNRFNEPPVAIATIITLDRPKVWHIGNFKIKMENRGLLFIPDISGFTRFITETEISHSRLIIQELLEILINANQLGLEVSEIEGDAILFYRFGDAPDIQKIYDQVQQMFIAFHKNRISYDHLRFCQCKACRSAINLTLKVITHYGEFASYNVKQFNKLIGKDVIVAHQLLKNDIAEHEYWLITKTLTMNNPPDKLATWMEWDSSAKQTETGAIEYYYARLTQLKNDLKPDPIPDPALSRKRKVVSIIRDFDDGLVPLLHAVGDFTYRSRWQEGVKGIEDVGHYLPRLGVRRRVILETGEAVVYASSYVYTPDKIEFSETEEQTGNTTYFTMEKLAQGKTRLTLDYYTKQTFLSRFFSSSKTNKLKASYERSLDRLAELVKEIKVPDTDAYL
jgi:hypothetical protein